jgi:hypothetical protein
MSRKRLSALEGSLWHEAAPDEVRSNVSSWGADLLRKELIRRS